MGGPEVPALPELGRPRLRLVTPQLAQRFLQRPRPSRLQRHRLECIEVVFGLLLDVLRVSQPQILTAGERVVPRLHQRLVLPLLTLSTASNM